MSPYSHLEVLDDYVEAEKLGKEVSECFKYLKRCPKSIFKNTGISSMQLSPNQENSGHESM